MDPVFDGIIIGAGHHGLVLGTYLAKAGLKILLVERRLMYGGGLATVEATLPGFYHNSHSINHFHISETPWFRDLALADKVAYVTPRYEFGQPHPDGSALVFSRDLEETLASVARFKAAASDPRLDTALKWNVGAESIADLVAAHDDVKNGRVPRIVQFGSGALSANDPAQAPPGRHTTYAWHVHAAEPRPRRAGPGGVRARVHRAHH